MEASSESGHPHKVKVHIFQFVFSSRESDDCGVSTLRIDGVADDQEFRREYSGCQTLPKVSGDTSGQ